MNYSLVPTRLGIVGVIVLAVVLMAAWVILAASRLVQGGAVERPERIPQLYGYTACLVGLIWALASVVSLVDHVLEYTAPLVASTPYAAFELPSVTSFEAFRATYDRSPRFVGPSDAKPRPVDSIPDAELRRQYAALRADRIEQVQLRARNGIASSVVGLVLGSLLLVFHWRWLKGRGIDLAGTRASATTLPPAGS